MKVGMVYNLFIVSKDTKNIERERNMSLLQKTYKPFQFPM